MLLCDQIFFNYLCLTYLNNRYGLGVKTSSDLMEILLPPLKNVLPRLKREQKVALDKKNPNEFYHAIIQQK